MPVPRSLVANSKTSSAAPKDGAISTLRENDRMRNAICILTSICWFACLFMVGVQGVTAQELTIDASTGQKFNRGIFGQNAHASTYISEGYQAAYRKNLAVLDRTSIRGASGGIGADSYNWKTCVGKNGVMVGPKGPIATGESTLELLRIARDNGSTLVLTVNTREIGAYADGAFHVSDESSSTLAALAKDWVRYANHILHTYRQGDTITDPEDLRILNEIDWKEADFGSDKLLAPDEEPVPKVMYWEIGNEVEFYDTPSTYSARYHEITTAMLQADTSIKVGPNFGGRQTGKATSYLLDLLRERPGAGRERVDFISYHPYGYQILGVDAEKDHAGIVRELNSIKANQVSEHAWIQDHITSAGRNPDDIELLATEWNPSTYDHGWSRVQYNGLGVIETAMTFAEMGMTAAHFWLWPAYIHNGDTFSQYHAFDALTQYGGDTLVKSHVDKNLRLYVTRDSETGIVAVWGLNFAFGEPGDAPRTLRLSLKNLGIEVCKITFMRLADQGGPTTLLSSKYSGAGKARPSVGWITTDQSGMDLSGFDFQINPAELSLLVIRPLGK